ncbi:hypothetical protein LCGC14_0533440 [marine sediment metagenome]|uniref:Uncharacterized protein n=1 Tax=marine sediment metagenome TaxID=412755 RepID=A0A0F9RZP8_9ZZZZ
MLSGCISAPRPIVNSITYNHQQETEEPAEAQEDVDDTIMILLGMGSVCILMSFGAMAVDEDDAARYFAILQEA